MCSKPSKSKTSLERGGKGEARERGERTREKGGGGEPS